MSALKGITQCLWVVVVALFAGQAWAQAPSYGSPITLDVTKKIAGASVAEAKKNNWNIAIAIVDNHGFLVYYEMMVDTQTLRANLAIEKARTAAMVGGKIIGGFGVIGVDSHQDAQFAKAGLEGLK